MNDTVIDNIPALSFWADQYKNTLGRADPKNPSDIINLRWDFFKPRVPCLKVI